MKRHANFSIVQNIDKMPLIIKDEGPWDVCPTVTNDVEYVAMKLYNSGLLKDGRKLYYYDSDGQLDEIAHYEGVFVGFLKIKE